jgi:hypothetical protein
MVALDTSAHQPQAEGKHKFRKHQKRWQRQQQLFSLGSEMAGIVTSALLASGAVSHLLCLFHGAVKANRQAASEGRESCDLEVESALLRILVLCSHAVEDIAKEVASGKTPTASSTVPFLTRFNLPMQGILSIHV